MTPSPHTVTSSDDSFVALSPSSDLDKIDPSINQSMCNDIQFPNFDSYSNPDDN